MKHPKTDRTLVIIKPDGIQRSLIGEIIQRYERLGLKMVAIKMTVPTMDLIEKHYSADPEWKKITGMKTIESYIKKGMKPPSGDPIVISNKIIANLKKYMTAGPVIAMVWEGAHAVPIVRKITGGTEPLSSDVGSIRGDFVLDSYEISDTDGRSIRNLIHASGSNADAEKEIDLWFEKNEIANYRHIQEKILYDVNMDGLLE